MAMGSNTATRRHFAFHAETLFTVHCSTLAPTGIPILANSAESMLPIGNTSYCNNSPHAKEQWCNCDQDVSAYVFTMRSGSFRLPRHCAHQ
jgi:hypothetical protein